MDQRVAVAKDPCSLGKLLAGHLDGLWRYRVGDYRVICEIQHQRLRVLYPSGIILRILDRA